LALTISRSAQKSGYLESRFTVIYLFFLMPNLSARRFNSGKETAAIAWLGAIIGIITVVALYEQIFGAHVEDITDIYDHLLVVKDMGPDGPWNLYSLFFLLVYILSFGSKDYIVLALAGTAVITASVIAKGILSYFVLRKATPSIWLAALMALALILVMPLPNWWRPEQLYLDKIVPTIWFNSTAMLTMPFAIWLFFAAAKWLKEGTTSSFLWVLVSAVLSVLTKPNFILAFLPVLGGVVLARALVSRSATSFWKLLLVIGLAALVGLILYIQSKEPVSSGPFGNPNAAEESVHVGFAPLAVWRLYSPNIPVSLLLSVVFPLGVAVLYFNEIKRDTSVLLAWAVLLVAIAQYALLAETGQRFIDANWIWASNFAMYLVFLVSTAVLLAQRRSTRFYFLAVLFGLHLASGIYYYARVALGLGYY
jgi:hypothetical protein